MTGRVRTATFAAILLARPAAAQGPNDHRPIAEPRLFPPIGVVTQPEGPARPVSPQSAVPQAPFNPGQQQMMEPRTGPKPDPSVRLPRPENLLRLDPSLVSVRRMNDSWQLWAGQILLRDFGTAAQDAQDAYNVIRTLRPTEWGAIGSPRPVVEYGLATGEPPKWSVTARQSLPIDLKTVRPDLVRGAWVVRDDLNILLNFGPIRGDAEQAAMVAKRYGFNRVGLVGSGGSGTPSMAFFYSAPMAPSSAPPADDAMVLLTRASQEASLARTAGDVPGLGLVGERLTLDSRKVEARKDKGEWVLANGPDVLARFGYSEMAARDALRVVKDSRLTEFCRVGSGMTFFLSNGHPPTRVTFAADRSWFDPTRLVPREANAGGWGVYEGNGRMLYPAATKEEAELLIKVILAYKFDQVCQVGSSPKASLRFLAKGGR